MEYLYPSDCGNAPKKVVLKDLIEAFAKNDREVIEKFCRKDVSWNIINDISVQGVDAIIDVLETKWPEEIEKLQLLNVITHGHTAAANGTASFTNGTTLAFCNVYKFVSPGKNLIKEMTSYVIKMDKTS